MSGLRTTLIFSKITVVYSQSVYVCVHLFLFLHMERKMNRMDVVILNAILNTETENKTEHAKCCTQN